MNIELILHIKMLIFSYRTRVLRNLSQIGSKINMIIYSFYFTAYQRTKHMNIEL